MSHSQANDATFKVCVLEDGKQGQKGTTTRGVCVVFPTMEQVSYDIFKDIENHFTM